MDEENFTEDEKPVAYDIKGRPLYLHPGFVARKERKPLTVHVAKSTQPERPYVSDVGKLRHERSKELYPTINLSEGEYVIRAVHRHPIGMFWPFAIGAVCFILLFVALVNADYISKSLATNNIKLGITDVFLLAVLLMAFCGVMMYVFYYVFTRNCFYLTNESIIQDIQYALFSKREQTVSLAEVEDTSYLQSGILQQMFNYGTIRLSTIGEEHTYKFTFVIDPKGYVATLNNAVEAFKNGLPVDSEI